MFHISGSGTVQGIGDKHKHHYKHSFSRSYNAHCWGKHCAFKFLRGLQVFSLAKRVFSPGVLGGGHDAIVLLKLSLLAYMRSLVKAAITVNNIN